MGDLISGADPLDPARIAEVKSWLASQFDAAGKDVPEFEYTPRSIAHLHSLATASQAKTQAAGIVAADFRQKAAEYRSQAHTHAQAQHTQEHRVSTIVWVDGRSRLAYKHFGDVVTFDTTYRTNKYSMPFAPFTGVNHHYHSILFGFTLLRDESEGSFVWLFRTWLEAMNFKAPKVIITDQDLAMKKAIATVFPDTRHNLCTWHISNKYPERLHHVYAKYPDFKQDFDKCITKSLTIEEFEERWEKLVRDYSLQDNEWLWHLYERKEQWIGVYTRRYFSAGMKTTGRSESMNATFDSYVAARIREILESAGLAQESLPANVVTSAQVLANVANLLNIRDTELSSFLVAMGDISLRKTGVEEKRAKVQKESKILLDYTRKAIARLTYLKRTLAQLEDDVAPCEAQMENWNTNLAIMVSKERQYLQQYSNYKAMLNRVGYTPEISHGVLVEMAEHRKDLEKKTRPILDTLRSYQDLPPDKALAALAIEDKKRQYAAAEKHLEDVLQSALATSE